jgi:hypothetical protein
MCDVTLISFVIDALCNIVAMHVIDKKSSVWIIK